MKLDRNSNIPLYIQFKEMILEMLRKGELKPGDMIKSEMALCDEYGISRYPIRQAMDELVAEGCLMRVRGRGTFVSKELPSLLTQNIKALGLIMPDLISGFNGNILSGFERQARKRGYLTTVCCSEGLPEVEMYCVDMLMENRVSGISVFPCDNSVMGERFKQITSLGTHIGLLDRNLGISELDYIGSDNFGGTYSAVRHLSLQGYVNILYVTERSEVSSVKERLSGYRKAVEDFRLNALENIYICSESNIKEQLEKTLNIRAHLPLGIVAVNDFTAIRCMEVLQEYGFDIGREVAVVGFDNIKEGSYQQVPLTTVAQNGLLMGSTAADVAIDKLEGKTRQIFRSLIPTQLVVRSSCGEKL